MKDERNVGVNRTSVTAMLNGTIGVEKPRFYDTDSLKELLAHRYNLSRHVANEKLIDLVTQELSI